MTLFLPDAKILILHYRLVWKATFALPFGLKAKFHIIVWPGTGFHITVLAAAEENLGFTVGIFHFLT
jgi:hypothetical protein